MNRKTSYSTVKNLTNYSCPDNILCPHTFRTQYDINQYNVFKKDVLEKYNVRDLRRHRDNDFEVHEMEHIPVGLDTLQFYK